MKTILIMTAWGLLLSLTAPTLAAPTAPPLPEAPARYVLDSDHLLTPQTLQILESMVIEHDRLTGEQVMIALFAEGPTEDVQGFSNQLFLKWRVGRGAKNNGALLTAFIKEKEAFLLTGYGLETLLTEAKAKSISANIAKRLGKKRPDHTLYVATAEILRTLESPLIQSGQISAVTFENEQEETNLNPIFWIISILIGLAFILVFFYFVTSAETHYTGKGWFHPKPWQLWKIKNSNTPLPGGTCGHW